MFNLSQNHFLFTKNVKLLPIFVSCDLKAISGKILLVINANKIPLRLKKKGKNLQLTVSSSGSIIKTRVGYVNKEACQKSVPAPINKSLAINPKKILPKIKITKGISIAKGASCTP